MKTININGQTYGFSSNIEATEVELFRSYIRSNEKPFILHNGVRKLITLSGRLNSDSKIVRKFIRAIKVAKYKPENHNRSVITVKLNDRTVKIRPLNKAASTLNIGKW